MIKPEGNSEAGALVAGVSAAIKEERTVGQMTVIPVFENSVGAYNVTIDLLIYQALNRADVRFVLVGMKASYNHDSFEIYNLLPEP